VQHRTRRVYIALLENTLPCQVQAVANCAWQGHTPTTLEFPLHVNLLAQPTHTHMLEGHYVQTVQIWRHQPQVLVTATVQHITQNWEMINQVQETMVQQ
jgi:hypothetical protein